MDQKISENILNNLNESDKVLDIGGWALPFNRANYVVDIMPYETRGHFGSYGGDKEFFTKDTWIYNDFSSSTPLPFKDNEFDFVICSHVLEDIRDPIFLCSELIRVAKKGYIEVPSKTIEMTKGVEHNNYSGYCHHKLLVEIEGNKVIFTHKNQLLYRSWKYHIPKSYLKRITPEEKYVNLFWEDNFDYHEVIQIGMQKMLDNFDNFVRSKNCYPRYRYMLSKIAEILENINRKLFKKDNTEKKNFWKAIPDILSK